jgi:hypothetical protein
MTGRRWVVALAVLACLGSAGCGQAGRVQVFVQAEDTIPNGLDPGTGPETVVDGWTIRYDKFLAVVGNIHAAQSSSGAAQLADPRLFVLDMKELPPGGLVISDLHGAEATRWDIVGYDLGKADGDSVQGDGISSADFQRMVDGGLTLYIEGHITKPDGEQCLPAQPTDCVSRSEVHFAWALQTATSFDGCTNASGTAGFAVPSGGTVQVKPTIHGDHWFFTNVTQGTEQTQRKAQWLADADLNRDGETTLAELEAVNAALLLTPSRGYDLSGSILPAILTVRDYVEAQARTIGDWQGDGECPLRTILN